MRLFLCPCQSASSVTAWYPLTTISFKTGETTHWLFSLNTTWFHRSIENRVLLSWKFSFHCGQVGEFGYLIFPDVDSDVLKNFGNANVFMNFARIGMAVVRNLPYRWVSGFTANMYSGCPPLHVWSCHLLFSSEGIPHTRGEVKGIFEGLVRHMAVGTNQNTRLSWPTNFCDRFLTQFIFCMFNTGSNGLLSTAIASCSINCWWRLQSNIQSTCTCLLLDTAHCNYSNILRVHSGRSTHHKRSRNGMVPIHAHTMFVICQQKGLPLYVCAYCSEIFKSSTWCCQSNMPQITALSMLLTLVCMSGYNLQVFSIVGSTGGVMVVFIIPGVLLIRGIYSPPVGYVQQTIDEEEAVKLSTSTRTGSQKCVQIVGGTLIIAFGLLIFSATSYVTATGMIS